MSKDLNLERLAAFPGRPGPLLIVIMDGVGIGRGDAGDAVAMARTPTLDALESSGCWLPIAAHGKAVGMVSDGDMGAATAAPVDLEVARYQLADFDLRTTTARDSIGTDVAA